MYKKLLKIIISNLFLIAFIFNQNVYSKPIPPGSGEGDVPANILILLDSSLSMKSKITDGATINHPYDIVEDSDGNLIMTGNNKQGVIKLLASTEQKDPNFGNKGKFKGTNKDKNCSNKDSSMKEPNNLGISSNVNGYTGDVIFASEHNDNNGKVVMFDKDGNCLDVITHNQLGKFRPRALTVRTIDSEDHLIVAGRWWKGYWAAYMYTRNLTNGKSRNCSVDANDFRKLIKNLWSMSLDDGSYLYVVNQSTSHIEGYELTKDADTGTYCPTDAIRDRHYQDASSGNAIRDADAVEVDPDNNNVLWIASYGADTVQRVTISGETVTASVTKGSYGKGNTTTDADVNIVNPYGLHITSSKVYVGVKNPTLLQFANDATITWENQLGGGAKTRLQGAKEAIKAIMNDSSLTSGANFGYGHWNAGRGHKNKWSHFGQKTCHYTTKGVPNNKIKNGNNDCPYADGWGNANTGTYTGKLGIPGTHPNGTSTLCNKDSCIDVGVHANGYTLIPDVVDATKMAWGTDANAFARMAWGYYTDPNVDIIDEDSDCQLNYVIVISDGAWTHGNIAEPLINKLRTEKDVKTLVVAYGGGIKGSSLDRYERMARVGSCDDPTGNASDCKAYIKADTPQELKTHLQSAIQQIIADRLSFTAPSITATIQEGGSLYQAQFNYQQYGEWQGTILRKAISAEGTVIHDPDHEGNWDAGQELKQQTSRNIWTAIPNSTYIGNWNNWVEGNDTEIRELFDLLDNRVLDYHNTTSTCTSATGVADGISDDIKGLINFLRGQDYFDYNGDCNLTEKRDWDGASMLGDIYHSQIVEIGPPNANFDFTDTNEEAFWRAMNNYQSFVRTHENRTKIIYAGANDGMMHAFNAETGQEAWAFIPPFVAGKLPTIINVGLDGNIDGKGGSNAIFGVDGSPVVHDMFIRGLSMADGITWEDGKSWRTILIVPYGRGGAGFSVLDVTYSLVKEGQGPMHMFSVYNDAINSKVLVATGLGAREEFPYFPEYIKWEDSREAQRAVENQLEAEDTDGADSTTQQDAIFSCQTQADTSSDFALNGDNACYRGTQFSFDFSPPEDVTITTSDFRYYESRDDVTGQKPSAISSSDGIVTLTFPTEKFFNVTTSDNKADDGSTETSYMRIKVKPSLAGVLKNDFAYNYSKLGETWSTPRVIRMPDPDVPGAQYTDDIYVFVMGGGMGSAVGRSGSNVFVVDLEDRQFPGSIAGSLLNKGPIRIHDARKTSSTPNASNIANAIPSAPIVIIPDNVPGVNWRGAMVYVNDLEGKITKINLTNLPDADLFQQRTIANLYATKTNARLSYHSMDAAIGRDTKNFWLFGATGHYERINDSKEFDNDNILYGIKDDYKSFTTAIPLEGGIFYDAWTNAARDHAEAAPRVDDLTVCKDTTNDTSGSLCPTSNDLGWVIYLNDMASNEHKKASAAPKVYKGSVYFPIYKPTQGANKCNIGSAYICSADDECGTNNSQNLTVQGAGLPDDDACYYVTQGILSELVVFGDTLFANVAGPSRTEDTLVSILAGVGEVSSYRRSWREGY